MPNRIKKVWTNKYLVSAADVDHHSTAKLTSLCNYFQESAWEHAENLKVGYEAVLKKNMAWVLSRLRLKVERYPSWKEEIILETWPKGADGPFALRDFSIISKRGDICARGASAWLLLDLESKRPARMEDELAHLLHFNQGVHSIEEKIPKLRESSSSEKIRTLVAGYTDMDANAHVNNVRYIAWALDSLKSDIHMNYRVSGFIINFLGETKMGESIELLLAKESEESFQVEGVQKEKKQSSFRARIDLERI